MKNAEEGCRKTKQELKKAFEELYKSLKSFVKKAQEAYIKNSTMDHFKEVTKPEIEVFKKYGPSNEAFKDDTL